MMYKSKTFKHYNQCFGSGSGNPQDFGFLYPDPQNYAEPRIRIQGAKYQQKNAKQNLLSNPKSGLLKKRDYKNFLIFEWFIKF